VFDLVTKNKRVIQVFLALIAITFATWGIESYTQFRSSRDTVASVDGMEISRREFAEELRRQQEQMRRMFGVGAEAVAALLMVGTIAGILMATFLNNSGGAWDNAKKFIESGAHGGKGSETHKAAVVGDTVGDPFKDTAGPSLHVLIKLLATITLVLAPLFV